MNYICESKDLTDFMIVFDNDMSNMLVNVYTEYAEYGEDLVLEKSGGILDAIANFFSKLIDKIDRTVTTIKLHVQRRVSELITKGKLAKLRRELSDMRSNGISHVKVIDYWYLRDRYYIALKELKDLGLKLSRVMYANGEDMNVDLKRWEKLKEKHDEIIKRASNKEVKIPINKMINFVDHELGKEQGLFDSIADLNELYRAMEANIESLDKRSKIFGAQHLVHHRDKTIALSPTEVFLVKNIATGLAKWATDTVVWLINKALLGIIGL